MSWKYFFIKLHLYYGKSIIIICICFYSLHQMQNNWRGRLPCQLIRMPRYSHISISWLQSFINHKTDQSSLTRQGTQAGHPYLRNSQAKCMVMRQMVYQMELKQSCSKTQRMPEVFCLTFIWQLRETGKWLWLQDRSKYNHNRQRQLRG